MCKMFDNKCLTLAVVAVIISGCLSELPGVVHDLSSSSELDWWQNAVFYQIYPRSFMDSDGDGTGDLKGIVSKLSYLKDTGVTATWLSPIFASPGIDQGYDISNYREIDTLFGTLDDFKKLVEAAKELGIKIILDFVPNHTSDKHEWFQNSENGKEGFQDFYIWAGNDPTKVPNNWLSEFGGSTWEWSDKRKQYYYHQFAAAQPDLNYFSPTVVKEMKDVLKFWLDQGVDGFRLDAVPYLCEDPSLRDAPLARGYTNFTNEAKSQDGTLILKDLPETYDIIYQFREFVDDYAKTNNRTSTIVLMSEAYTTPENTMLYYESYDGQRKGAHFAFNFNFITYLKNENFTVDDISNAINKWLVYLPQGASSNWVLGNHDNHRVASRFGEENVDVFNMLTAFLPGVMVTYNGEEIGMLDGEVNCTQGRDPGAIKDCTTFPEKSRDFERTPFQWDDSEFAGFTNGTKTWLPVGSSKDRINLKAEVEPGVDSHYNIYKQLLKFRQNFQKGNITDNIAAIKVTDHVLQIVRHYDNDEYVLLLNVGKSQEKVEFYKKSPKYTVLVASTESPHKPKTTISGDLTMEPHEGLILKGVQGKNSAQSISFSLSFFLILSLLCYIF